jgi:SNF2 family DNA or RNA helicase
VKGICRDLQEKSESFFLGLLRQLNVHIVSVKPLTKAVRLPDVKVSSKMLQMLSILEDIKARSRGKEKTIVFSQFTSLLDEIASFLKTRGYTTVQCTSYKLLTNRLANIILDDGRMSVLQKDIAKMDMLSDPKATVMLVSLKAGGTGMYDTFVNYFAHSVRS